MFEPTESRDVRCTGRRVIVCFLPAFRVPGVGGKEGGCWNRGDGERGRL